MEGHINVDCEDKVSLNLGKRMSHKNGSDTHGSIFHSNLGGTWYLQNLEKVRNKNYITWINLKYGNV